MFRSFLVTLFDATYTLNKSNILSFCQTDPKAKILDLGCDDGIWTEAIARKIGTSEVHGIEIVPERAAAARERGISVVEHDLNYPLPYADGSFDMIHANQVIEHVGSIDTFTAEIFRCLRPGGYVVISTENASSWHNIGATILGWQMFSLTNLSVKRLGVGNPLAVHRHDTGHLGSWTHKTIFSYRGLIEFLGCHQFRHVQIRGSGYYPLAAKFGLLDPRHAHFITAYAQK